MDEEKREYKEDDIASTVREFRSFEGARKFVHSLRLKNEAEWKEYSISGEKPVDIPAAPNVVYKQKWKGMGDWLETP
jgi:hypothetical protein